jgi:hypothetical protein
MSAFYWLNGDREPISKVRLIESLETYEDADSVIRTELGWAKLKISRRK